MFNANSGYIGQKMSKRALEAYESGEKPLSKWTKTAILEAVENYGASAELMALLRKTPLAILRIALLRRSSWHHTGKFYNRTVFREIDTDILDNEQELKQELMRLVNYYKADKQEKNAPQVEYVKASIQVWGGTKKHPRVIGKAYEYGIKIGGWFYPVIYDNAFYNKYSSDYSIYQEKRKVLGNNFNYVNTANSYKEFVKKNPEIKGTVKAFNNKIKEKGGK